MQPEPTEDELRAAWTRMAEARTGRAAPIGAAERPVSFEAAMADRLLAPIIHAAALSHRRAPAAPPAPQAADNWRPGIPARMTHARPARTTQLANHDRKRAAAGDLDDNEQDETE